MRNIWDSWKKTLKRITNAQVNIILTVIFLVVIMPISFIKGFSEKVSNSNSKDKKEESYWQSKLKYKDIKKWARKP